MLSKKWNLEDLYADWGAWESHLQNLKNKESVEKYYAKDFYLQLEQLYFYANLKSNLNIEDVIAQNAKLDILKYRNYCLGRKNDEQEKNIELDVKSAKAVLDAFSSSFVSYKKMYLSLYSELIKSEIKIGGITLIITASKFNSLLRTLDKKSRNIVYRKIWTKLISQKNNFAELIHNHLRYLAVKAEIMSKNGIYALVLSKDCPLYNNIEKILYYIKEKKHIFLESVQLKSKLFGNKLFYAYEIWMPIKKINKKYTIEKAYTLIRKALSILGDDYLALIDKGIIADWLHIVDTENGRSGAYTFGVYGKEPKILINWSGSIRDIIILAHELAHAVHIYLNNQSKEIDVNKIPVQVSEVFSVLNEIIVIKYLLDTSDEENEIIFLNECINHIKSSLFQTAMLSAFERELVCLCENDKALNVGNINKVYFKHLSSYYNNVLLDEMSEQYGWIKVSHLYNTGNLFRYLLSYLIAYDLYNNLTRDSSYTNIIYEWMKMGAKGTDHYYLNEIMTVRNFRRIISDIVGDYQCLLVKFCLYYDR